MRLRRPRGRTGSRSWSAVTLHYDEDLVEAVVFRCASGARNGISPLQVARFHRQREKLYAIASR